MSAPSPFDNLPPELLEAVAAQVAEAFAAGHAAAMERAATDAPKVYQLGYDAGVRDDKARDWQRYWAGFADGVATMTGAEADADTATVDVVDPEALAAVARISARLDAAPTADPSTPAARAHRMTLRPTLRTRRAGR